MACSDLSDSLMKFFIERRYFFTTTAEGESVVMSKRNFATCRLTTTQSSNRPRKVLTRIRLTSSQTVTSSLGAERFRCTSVLSASFIGIQASALYDTLSRAKKCYVNIRKELYANVVLPSSTTMFQRIVERMTKNRRRWLHPR